MNISIVGRHFELTDAIKEHIENAIDALKKYNLDIISTRVVIDADERNGKKGYSAEFVIHMANKNTVVIRQKDKDVYAAVDLAIERAQKVLRRHHDKVTEHKSVRPDELAAAHEAEIAAALADDSDGIVPMELDLYKPLEIEEALNMLKSSPEKQFLVFNDIDGKMRVLYRRGDGRFGLY
ncbi:MAG: ribosome-associated translation inhibitor RaiA [Hydrogenimonas sp.]|nr:ribosome-associated translation inhibitor RaiA [Hydrogenimonas sp.]